MNISFAINILLRKGLTADDYTICTLIKEKKYGLLKLMYEILGDSMHERIAILVKEEYLSFNGLGTIMPIKELKVTQKFESLISVDDPFEEFYNKYPTSVIRIDGKRDYLRGDKAKCRIRYKKLTDKNPLYHKHILECLVRELEQKEKSQNMGYFKRMINWIDQEEWKKHETEYKEDSINNKSFNNIGDYGSNLL